MSLDHQNPIRISKLKQRVCARVPIAATQIENDGILIVVVIIIIIIITIIIIMKIKGSFIKIKIEKREIKEMMARPVTSGSYRLLMVSSNEDRVDAAAVDPMPTTDGQQQQQHRQIALAEKWH